LCALGPGSAVGRRQGAKKWLVLSHSSNNTPFMIMTSPNALSLETRRGFTITSRRQNVQAWSGNTRVPTIGKIQVGQVSWQSDGYGVLGPQGCALGGFRGKATTINVASYYATLERLRTAIQKRLGLLTTGVMFLHDSVRTHVATATRYWWRFRWTILGTSAIQCSCGAE
jgi:hypothetical protein